MSTNLRTLEVEFLIIVVSKRNCVFLP